LQLWAWLENFLSPPSIERGVMAALAARPLRDQAWILLALNCGFRVREIMSLNVSHVWDAGRVRGQVRLERGSLKGGRGPRRAARSPRGPCCSMPQSLRCWSNICSPGLGPGIPAQDEPLFPSRNRGGRLSRWRANEIIHELLKSAGVPDVNLYGTHSCRKAFCMAIFCASKNDLNLTRVAMGHASVTTTQKYLTVSQSAVDRCVLTIGLAVPALGAETRERLNGATLAI